MIQTRRTKQKVLAFLYWPFARVHDAANIESHHFVPTVIITAMVIASEPDQDHQDVV
jgi:uncharacterized metal-binding protein